jgi:ATP synthase protein I
LGGGQPGKSTRLREMQNWRPAVRFLGIGFYIAFCIVAGIMVGLWIDSRFHTGPIFLLIGLVLGLVSAFWGLYQMLLPLIKDNRKGRK